jgi:hypothetical protein
MEIRAGNALAVIEGCLDPFLFDFQEETLKKALARIPERRAAYEAGLLRDNALGELSSAVDSSNMSLKCQTVYYRRLRCILLRRIGRAMKNEKRIKVRLPVGGKNAKKNK